MSILVKITTEVRPFFNGRATEHGETINVTQDEADIIVKNGWGEIEGKKVRARNKKGFFKADDPNTPENEAWEIKK